FIARPATRFIRRIADFHLRVSTGDALRVMRGTATADADRVHFRNVFRDREQRGHRTERTAHVILIETRRDDANARVGELHANVDDTVIEELNLADADDLHADLDFREELFTRRNRNR